MKSQKTFLKTGIVILVASLFSRLLPMAVAQGNLVYNGGFETDASGWTADNISGGYTTPGDNSAGCYFLYDFNSAIPTISQEINDLTPGQLYLVSGNYKSGGKNFAADSFGTAINNVFLFLTNSPSDYNWYSFSFDYTATSTSALLSLSAQLNDTGYAYYIDNISMEAVPEPGNLSLMGIGGIVGTLFWKRCR
jgi:hypothetical protein